MCTVILLGGRSRGPHPDTTICQAEISADARGLRPRWLLIGQVTQEFETAFATTISATHAFAESAAGGQPTYHPCPIILDPANRAA